MPWSSSGTTATSESRAQHRLSITAPRLPHAQPAEMLDLWLWWRSGELAGIWACAFLLQAVASKCEVHEQARPGGLQQELMVMLAEPLLQR